MVKTRPARKHQWQLRGLTVLAVAGLVMIGWPAGQTLYSWRCQTVLRQSWDEAARAEAPDHQAAKLPPAPAQTSMSVRADKTRGGAPPSAPRVRRAWPPTRIVVPEIDLDAVVVDGITASALRQGPGHDPQSDVPSEPGNCVIAGHRNVYGSWFGRLNQLEPDSLIDLRTVHQTFVYQVAASRVVPETATALLMSPRNRHQVPQLTLYTCTLPHSGDRIVVTANLIYTENTDDGLRAPGGSGWQ